MWFYCTMYILISKYHTGVFLALGASMQSFVEVVLTGCDTYLFIDYSYIITLKYIECQISSMDEDICDISVSFSKELAHTSLEDWPLIAPIYLAMSSVHKLDHQDQTLACGFS